MKYFYQTPAADIQNMDLNEILTDIISTSGPGEIDIDLGGNNDDA